MVKCTDCKHGQLWIAVSIDEKYKMVYCELTDDSIGYEQAIDDLPCDCYEQKLDDYKTQESC